MRKLSTDEIMKIASNSIDQVRRVDWNQKGRVDFVMAARIRDIAASLKELKRRKVDASSITEEVEWVLSDIEEKYKGRINRLSITLLGEPPRKRKAKRISERNVIIKLTWTPQICTTFRVHSRSKTFLYLPICLSNHFFLKTLSMAIRSSNSSGVR